MGLGLQWTFKVPSYVERQKGLSSGVELQYWNIAHQYVVGDLISNFLDGGGRVRTDPAAKHR